MEDTLLTKPLLTPQRKLRIGLLGASYIAEHAILIPGRTRADIAVTAVAASDSERAKAYADKHGIAGIAQGYAALVVRDDVDVVYNALTPSDHCRWTIAALEAGKHVLCEKPFAMNADEAQRMVVAAAANGRLLIEAWHYRFHPLMRRMEEIVHSGVLGKLRHARARFDAPTPPSLTEFRWHAALGGGSLMDTGGYTVHALRTLIGREPVVLSARADWYDDTDLAMSANLDFGEGLNAEISCAIAARDLASELRLEGESGSLLVEGFPLPQYGCRLRLETKDGIVDERPADITSYAAQLAHVAAVFLGDALPVTGGQDAIANMRVIDAIYGAARHRRTEGPA